ncbi:MAG: hypothetical protein MZU97_03240 [Bacillus subtilis]|nr:hypothetical protein [Bacillus subtilis]
MITGEETGTLEKSLEVVEREERCRLSSRPEKIEAFFNYLSMTVALSVILGTIVVFAARGFESLDLT